MRSCIRILPSLLVSLAIGCAGGEPGVSQTDALPADATPPNCDNPPQLTYANFGSPFLSKYCDACHGFTHLDMRDESATIIDVAAINTYMPLGSPFPSSVERMELGTWLACGAP